MGTGKGFLARVSVDVSYKVGGFYGDVSAVRTAVGLGGGGGGSGGGGGVAGQWV